MKENLKYIALGVLLFLVVVIIICILAAAGVITVNADSAFIPLQLLV